MKPFKKAHCITEDKRKNQRFFPNSAFSGTSFILDTVGEMFSAGNDRRIR